jgi:hypothetical protein
LTSLKIRLTLLVQHASIFCRHKDNRGTNIMIEGIQIENGKYGRCAVATSLWSDEISSFVLHHGIKELELNRGKGWRGNGLLFLAKLPQLEALTIIDLKISSVDPIHLLPNLRALEITTYCQTEIRLSTFPQLEECILEWRPKATSLFDCKTL